MTKTQAFVDGFVGKPIKNECFNLWDLNAIIREKQAKLYLRIFLLFYDFHFFSKIFISKRGILK
ncbi:hypothetical protein D1Z26_05320 [Campylobacter coli]|uniref:hypothetical protein n=1 Tax=Campylobacter coli TaxID=195 RepID=UPI000F96C4A8|nr:hypothetical protein [Campylobacter coli]EAH4500260.1 hypothetical protein [Campylobacter jejuni]EAH5770703.1 hypothetical protein [Campylobacter coli]EAH5986598.1 hypothetical protein [Campylobacter coli]EAH6507443.1 hypothetical protein [Campylobacter coli]EAH6958161.1 hypothetical protein [Campylobacter coli]